MQSSWLIWDMSFVASYCGKQRSIRLAAGTCACVSRPASEDGTNLQQTATPTGLRAYACCGKHVHAAREFWAGDPKP